MMGGKTKLREKTVFLHNCGHARTRHPGSSWLGVGQGAGGRSWGGGHGVGARGEVDPRASQVVWATPV